MKHVKWKICIIIGSMLFLLCGCVEEEGKENFYIIKDDVSLPEETIEDLLQETNALLTATDSILRVYYPDLGLEYILSKQVEVDIITADEIMKQLHEKDFLNKGVKLEEILAKKENEKIILFLNFSSDFLQQLDLLEPDAKRIFFGSVVNTFLTAYHADAIEIKIDGKKYFNEELLELSDGELSKLEQKGYYTSFPSFNQSTMEDTVVINGVSETVTYQKIFCNEEYAMYYDWDNFDYIYDEEIGKALFLEKKAILPKEITNQFSIRIVEESKVDTVSEITENGLGTVIETKEEVIGDGYPATVIIKQGETSYHKWSAEFYIFENVGSVYVAEVLLEEENAPEYQVRIKQMLNTLRIIQ